MKGTLISIIETSAFTRAADKILSDEEREELIIFLAENPEAGDEIPGTGGVRKARFAAQGRGKSGGVRVIYYYFDNNNPLYALLIYPKGAQETLSADQAKIVASLAASIKAAAKARRR